MAAARDSYKYYSIDSCEDKDITYVTLGLLTCKIVVWWRVNRTWARRPGILLMTVGTISSWAPEVRAKNISTTEGSKVKGEARKTTSSGVTSKRVLWKMMHVTTPQNDSNFFKSLIKLAYILAHTDLRCLMLGKMQQWGTLTIFGCPVVPDVCRA